MTISKRKAMDMSLLKNKFRLCIKLWIMKHRLPLLKGWRNRMKSWVLIRIQLRRKKMKEQLRRLVRIWWSIMVMSLIPIKSKLMIHI